MGYWSNISGYVKIKKSEHFSLIDKINEFGDETHINEYSSETFPDYFVHKFEFVISNDGWELERSIYKWIRGIPAFEKQIQLTTIFP